MQLDHVRIRCSCRLHRRCRLHCRCGLGLIRLRRGIRGGVLPPPQPRPASRTSHSTHSIRLLMTHDSLHMTRSRMANGCCLDRRRLHRLDHQLALLDGIWRLCLEAGVEEEQARRVRRRIPPLRLAQRPPVPRGRLLALVERHARRPRRQVR